MAQRASQPELFTYWLGIAAEQPRTFYGLLARRLLGIDPDLDFDAEPFTELDARILTGLEAGRRALALLEVGERGRAEAELRALAPRDNPALLQSLAGARRSRRSAGAQPASSRARSPTSDGRQHDRALYPVPRWTPRGGFTVDRALLYRADAAGIAVPAACRAARRARSGLMQLMPATARAMAARTGVRLRRGDERDDARRSPIPRST